MTQEYPHSFKVQMVKLMTGPDAISAGSLAKQVEPCQSVLSGWLRKARAVGLDNFFKDAPVDDNNTFSPAQKMQFVIQADALDQEQLGPFLRENALHIHQLQQWKKLMLGALDSNPNPKPISRADKKKISQLERELDRKDKALAETAALLVLQKKVQSLWDEEPRSHHNEDN